VVVTADDLPVHRFQGRDGAALAYRELGDGRPLVLLHGYFSSARENWIRYGHAATLAGRGFRVVMPDLRAHGDSAKPHDAEAYLPDVLADDAFALIEHLDVTGYDLAGYSLGGRTALRMLARGADPRRAVVAGTGLEPIVDVNGRGERFRRVLTNLGTFERGTWEWRTEAFLKTMRGDPEALVHILDTFVSTPREQIGQVKVPTLVLISEYDTDHGDARALAAALPHGEHATVGGTHMSAVAKSTLGTAIADFLA
jgi:pimeloyl-ACP methyl ester carboxylesterase